MSFCSVYFALIFLIQLILVFSNFIPVQWNISTDVGHSLKERFYKYPMFTDVAPFDCDITANFCDVGCCVDPDCSVEQKQIFNCNHETGRCSRPMARYDCSCISERPNWFPALCYVFENPIYLGMFFKNQPKIENLKLFEKLSTRGKFKYKIVEWNEREYSENHYEVDTPILSYLSLNESYLPYPHAVLGKSDKFQGFLQDCRGSVKYMKNKKENCLIRVTKELCQDGSALGVRSYLLTGKGNSNLKNLPFVFKNLDTKEIADVAIKFRCALVNYYEYRLRETRHRYFYVKERSQNCNFHENLLDTFWNGNQCQNVLIQAEFEFTTNISEIVNVSSRFILANISLQEVSFFEDENFVSDKTSYINRVHNVIFKDISKNMENVKDNPLYNRGYYMGENLNFGYKRTNGSQFHWERGYLGMFVNGKACDQRINVTFGYDSYAKCSHRSKMSNCSLLREKLSKIYDSLLVGDHLAPYSNFRAPYTTPIPILRNYGSDEIRTDLNNSSICLLPVHQDIFIQYITIRAVHGFAVHRAIGLFVNRTFDVIASLDSITLTAQVAFFEISPHKKRRISRFWQKIFSPEQSENSWMNLLRVFDQPHSGDEFNDPTLWFLLVSLTIYLITTFFRN